MMKCTHLSNLVHNRAFLTLFLFCHQKEELSLVSHSSLFTSSNAYMGKMVKGGKHRNSCWAGRWAVNAYNDINEQIHSSFLPLAGWDTTFPKSFLQSYFESPCPGATKGTKPGGLRGERVPSILEGCRCSTGSLLFDPWFNSEDTSAEALEIPSSSLPVCCHLGIA